MKGHTYLHRHSTKEYNGRSSSSLERRQEMLDRLYGAHYIHAVVREKVFCSQPVKRLQRNTAGAIHQPVYRRRRLSCRCCITAGIPYRVRDIFDTFQVPLTAREYVNIMTRCREPLYDIQPYAGGTAYDHIVSHTTVI